MSEYVDKYNFIRAGRQLLNCSCCGRNKMITRVLLELTDLYSLMRTSPEILTITSGYRCDKHEKEVGGSGDSHPHGYAVDIAVAEGEDLALFVRAIQSVDVPRVILYNTTKKHTAFVHLDWNRDLSLGLFIS